MQMGHFLLDRGHVDEAEKVLEESVAIYARNPARMNIDRNTDYRPPTGP